MQFADVIRRLKAMTGRGNVVKDVDKSVATNAGEADGSVHQSDGRTDAPARAGPGGPVDLGPPPD